MRERVKDRGRLEHILEAINEIQEYASHPEVDWRVIEKMRHVLVHGYYTVDPESLWDTIECDIPELKPWIEKYLQEQPE